MLNLKIHMFDVCVLSYGYFLYISGRGNECSPGNSNLDVFSFISHIQLLFLGNFLSSQQKENTI